MKKIIFLISLCLLSQNYTIANENGESHYNSPSSVEQTNGQGNFLRTQNAYSSSLLKQNEQPAEENKALNKSDLKYPGLKLPQIEQESVKEPEIVKVSETSKPVEETPETEVKQVVELKPKTITKTQEKTVENNSEKTVAEEEPVQSAQQPQSEQQTQAVTQQPQTEQKTQVQQPQEPMSAMDILRSQTQAQTGIAIRPTKKIKKIPQSVEQKYKLNKNSITVEKRQSEDDKNGNQPVTITIKKVEFPESKVFTQEELQGLAAPLLAGPVTLDDIKRVVESITRCYTLGDYPTAKAYVPPQKITDGVLKIALIEGTIGKINVTGNRWVKASYVKKRIARDQEGELLNIEDLEKDVVKFNNNNTAKVNVSLNAGENQGESDITLNVTEQFPFKISVMTDNQGRKSIGTGRFGSMITTDSLFGVSDKMALGGYLGRGNRIGFADYSIPVGTHGTRLGASAAAGNISVVNGPMRQFDVGGTSQVYSIYVMQPIVDAEGFNISSYTSANFKKSTSDIMDYKFYDKSTFSLTQGFNIRKDTDRGIWYTGHMGSVGFKALSGDQDFFKYEGNITRLHDFGKGIIGQFRVSGQYSPDNDLPWMEQFQIGGISTVRGYSEALLLGKSGYFASAEIITPLPILPKRIGSDKLGYIYPREMIKGAIFMDNGMIFPYKYGESIDSGELLMSWGFGLRVNLKSDLAARFYWGYGLHNRYDYDYKMGRFHFDITCAPDIGRLVDGRKPAKKKSGKTKENL